MHEVAFAPEARDDLKKLYLFIAERVDGDRAWAHIERVQAYCRGCANFPERGTRGDDLLPGLRGFGFERRVTIAFRVGADTLTFLRILDGGRDIDGLLQS